MNQNIYVLQNGEVPVSARAISWMLLGAVGSQAATNYLLSSQDEYIRWYSYEIIGTTLAIFAGVLVFDSAKGCLAIVAEKFEYGEDATLALAVAHMLFWVMALQIVLGFFASAKYSRAPSDQRELDVKCCGAILAHIAAFAAVDVCLRIQHTDWFSQSPLHALLVAPTVGIFIWSIFLVMEAVRDAVIKRARKVTHGQQLWDEGTREAENDAICIAISFAVINALQFWILGRLPRKEELMGIHLGKRILLLDFCCMIGGALCIVVAFTMLALLSDLLHMDVRHVVVSMQFLSMCFAWMLLCAAKALANLRFPNLDFARIDIKIELAANMTLFAVAAMFGLHKLAGKMQRGGRKQQAVINVILSQGLLVGLSWEQCFFKAVDSLGYGTFVQLHWAFLLCLIVVPAYRWYVLPMISCATEVCYKNSVGTHKASKQYNESLLEKHHRFCTPCPAFLSKSSLRKLKSRQA